MSAGFAVLAIGLASFGNAVLWTTPAPYPWTLVAIVGLLVVLLTPRSSPYQTDAARRDLPFVVITFVPRGLPNNVICNAGAAVRARATYA